MDIQRVIRLLRIANNYLPSVEQRYEKLKREVYSIEANKRNSTIILNELSDQITDLSKTLDSYRLLCKELGLEITKLQLQKIRLEALVNDFQNNNEEYIKITRAVEDKVLGVLSNGKVLIRYALLFITESIRNDPERYRLFFANTLPF